MDNPQNPEIPNLGLSFSKVIENHPHGKQIEAFVADNIEIWVNDPEMIRTQMDRFVVNTGISRMDTMLWSFKWICSNRLMNQDVSRYVLCEWIRTAYTMFDTPNILGQMSNPTVNRHLIQGRRQTVQNLYYCVQIARAYAVGAVKLGPLKIGRSKAKIFYETCAQFHPHLPEEPTSEERMAVLRTKASTALSGAVLEATSLDEIPDRTGSYVSRGFLHAVFFVQFMNELEGLSNGRAKDLAFDFALDCYQSLGLLLRVPR